MEKIDIKGEKGDFFIPRVLFDPQTGVCEISGESYLEETIVFYKPIIEWVEEYTTTGKPIEFNFKLSYFNTSSSKRLLDIMRLLKKYRDSGALVTVRWYYEEDDIDSVEDVEDFIIVSKLDIQLVEVKKME